MPHEACPAIIRGAKPWGKAGKSEPRGKVSKAFRAGHRQSPAFRYPASAADVNSIRFVGFILATLGHVGRWNTFEFLLPTTAADGLERPRGSLPLRNLTSFFGDDKPLRSITTGDGDQFKAWLLTQGLAPATVAKRLSFARSFFHVARKHKLIDDNPFSEVKIPRANVSARQRFIDRDAVQRMLDAASPTWRIIIALARYGGLRCPSEVLSVERRHVDWERNCVTVVSPKTDRYDGKGTRTIPLFTELRPFLEDAFEQATPGQTHVVGGEHLAKAQGPNGWRNCNLRTTFEKLVRRAGLEPWPRLFHNLRSSRETELLESFPVHVVAQWMGHDAKVSLKHYAQTTTSTGPQAAQKVAHRRRRIGRSK